MNQTNKRDRVCVFLLTAVTSIAVGCEGEEANPDPEPTPEIAEGIFGPLGDPVEFATREQLETFARGRELVARQFTPEMGLGPLFNLSSCGGCHERPVFGGSAPRYRDFYLTASKLPDGSFITPPQAGIEHAYGLSETELRPEIAGNWNIQARRNPLPFFGVGLLAELTEDSILANADPDDADGDGISGRPNFDNGFVGRFGRKAQTVSIEGFIRGPLNNHLGITSDPLSEEQRARLPVDSSTPEITLEEALRRLELESNGLQVRVQGQAAPPSEPLTDTDDVADPELSTSELFDITSFSMLLAVPPHDPPTEQSERGRVVFGELGCASCHVPTLEGPRGLIPAYSDLLLHDMGEAMADGLEQGVAMGSEFRTQPLWGVAAVAPYLHDGRADTLDGAILWHGGEGQAARDAYAGADATARADVIAFLESLGGLDRRSEGLLPPNAPVPSVGEVGAPIEELVGADLELFVEGRRLFDRDMGIGDGLGPFFNGDSCRACHFAPVIAGGGPADVNVMRHATFVASSGSYVLPPAGTILPKFGLFTEPRPTPGATANVFEPRQPPHSLGLGLIEGIAEETIAAGADPDDADGDGVSGRVSVVPGDRIGRFGWKAQVPSIREFVRDAMGAELGLTTPAEPTLTFGARADLDDVADPELSLEALDALEYYLANLGPPPRVGAQERGAAVFEEIGCASCHTPRLPGVDGPVALYSDLLLHDVAPDGYIGIPDGTATGREFRTPPLWGLSTSAPYMHDGFTSTVRGAIERHFAEGAPSAAAFGNASVADQEALLAFLTSL